MKADGRFVTFFQKITLPISVMLENETGPHPHNVYISVAV